MPFRIKIRLMELGKKQRDLIPELAKMGIKTEPAELSNALSGLYQKPKLDRILSACNVIVTAWEKKISRTPNQREEGAMGQQKTVFLSIGLSLIVTLIGAILHLRQVDKMLNTYMENLNKVHERFLKNVNQRYGQK